ncbi:beta-lactamase-like protein [Mycena latifolia]|nr:beta-lactamase-like protein [Mycena latifolia]
MSSEVTPPLPPPAEKQAYMHISAMQAGIINLRLDLLVAGEPPTLRACPSLSFYLKHSASDRHFIFDLGLRRELASYPPEVQRYLKLMPCKVSQSVEESCAKGGLAPAAVGTVVISHLHFDHIGDHSPFTNATFVLGGGGKARLANGYPVNPESTTQVDATPVDHTVFLDGDAFTASIGPFPRADDFFGDGSVFIVDTPGHCEGHITVLARTSPDGAWVYLGGDVAHDTRLVTSSEAEIAMVDASGEPCCMHGDVGQAAVDIARVRALLRLPRVECIIAHDSKWYEDNVGHAFLPGTIVPKSSI